MKNGYVVYFESLLPTVAMHDKLVVRQWAKDNSELRYRPCYKDFPENGIYHPAKNKNGVFIDCDYKPLEEFLKECNSTLVDS